MATTSAPRADGRTSLRLRVQKFGTYLSNMVLPNIGAFIAWGLITALVIETGWITLIGGDVFGYEGGYGIVEDLGAWGSGVDGPGIVGPMITYLLPLLIGFTGGRMAYDDNHRGGVVGAIATLGVIAGTDVPMFLGAMVLGPFAGWSMKRIDALWDGKIRPGFEMLVNNFSAGIWGGIVAVFGYAIAGPFVESFSDGARTVVDFLVERDLLPLTSIFIEPAKILFLNNALNHGIFTPLGTSEAQETGKSILFLLEANPGPGLGLLLAFAFFGRGIARASAPGAALIQFVGGIHEIYFPYVLMKPVMLLAVIGGGMTGVAVNVGFDSGLRAPAAPGSIIAVWSQTPADSFLGVTLSVIASAAVTFLIAAFLLKLDRSDDDGDLAGATSSMEQMKGRSSVASGALAGAGASSGPVRSIVFACDAGMGSSAMGASLLRRKVHEAGFTDVSVTNKAISNLRDEHDVVVTHEDLTDRARQRSGSAVHVSVDTFMSSPRYDEIVELVRERNGGAVADADPATDDGEIPGELLSTSSIVLDGAGGDREAAIEQAGRLLLDAGAVDPAYVEAMHERERSVSTFMGNGLAIPHGTNEAKADVRRTAISFVRYPDGVDWNGKQVTFVIGIAAIGDEHLTLLGRIGRIFTDAEQVRRLETAETADEVLEVLQAVQPA